LNRNGAGKRRSLFDSARQKLCRIVAAPVLAAARANYGDVAAIVFKIMTSTDVTLRSGNAVIIARRLFESMSLCMNTSIAGALTLRASQQQSARTGKTPWPSVSISTQIPTTV
jgi:hypothetical protein